MITLAGKYADVGARASKALGTTNGGRPSDKGPEIFVPQKSLPFDEWFWRELREGGRLRRYLEREKGTSQARHRAMAQRTQHFQQNYKSDLELKATVPMREFIRWRNVDPHFWEDNQNIKSYVRDNPEARAWAG